MAIIGSITKQPREVIDFDISFEEILDARPGVTLSTATSEVLPSGTLTVLLTTINDKLVKCMLSGGLSGTKYKVTVLTTTSNGLIIENEVYVSVQEV
jgi:hypothetical protein